MQKNKKPFERREIDPGWSSGDDSEQLDLLKYWQIFLKRWPVLLAAIAVVFIAGVLYTLKQPKLFKATASVIVAPYAPQVLTGVRGVEDHRIGAYERSFLKTEESVMKSRAVKRLVAQRLGLYMPPDDGSKGAGPEPGQRFMKGYTVEGEKNSRIFNIGVYDKDPAFAAKMANAVASTYMEYNVDKRVDSSKDAGAWLAVRHGELKGKLEKAEENLYGFMKEHQIMSASFDGQLAETRSRLNTFQSQLTDLQSRKISTALDRETLSRLKKSPELVDILPKIQNASSIERLKEKLLDLRGEHESLKGKYLPAHPNMTKLRAQIAALTSELDKEIRIAVMRLKREELAIATTEEGLRKVVAEETQKEGRMNELALAYGKLKREVETNSKFYDMVTNRLKETDLTGMLRVNNVSILDWARVPFVPAKPNWQTNLMVSLLLGLMLGVGLVFLLELLDTSFKSQEEVEAQLGVPFLGVLPIIEAGDQASKAKNNRLKDKVGERQRDLFVLKNPKGMVAECSRAIRTNLHFISPDNPLKTLMVTSAMPKEGKTTSAINLAITMAQAGAKVLIVDTDMRRPRIHRSFNIANDQGISSLILGDSSFDQAIVPSELQGLDVLPCGPVPPNPSELMHTKRFADVINGLKERYDKILFDAPPVGAVTDPVILGTQVDGAVLIVKTGKTPRVQVQHALRALQDANVRLLGLVLNDMDINTKKYGYYYGKYYRYGRYYGNYGEGEEIKAA